jgi:hypothetical protein
VPEDDRHGACDQSVDDVEVGVAQSHGRGADAHLVGTEDARGVDVADDERLTGGFEDGCSHEGLAF